MELLGAITLAFGVTAGYSGAPLKPGGKRLEAFEGVDLAYITVNKLLTALFSYHAIAWVWYSPVVVWPSAGAGPGLTLLNTLAALPALFLTYDLPYTLFHRALHTGALYPYIHKHHHRQVVPFRGNLDAVNVHPFEFVVGEYNHLLAAWAVASAISAITGGHDGLHVATVGVFVILGGLLASLNHTRFDVRLDIASMPVFRVALHDVHHHQYTSNYAQYVAVWDWAFGTYRADVREGAGKAAAVSSSKLD
jgi:sterol desaturase/sphingolipid hydroxylase (fatty acid hydroxylase superfamily)